MILLLDDRRSEDIYEKKEEEETPTFPSTSFHSSSFFLLLCLRVFLLSISRYKSLLFLNGHRSETSSCSFVNSGKKNLYVSRGMHSVSE
jgi:hypothetical protein